MQYYFTKRATVGEKIENVMLGAAEKPLCIHEPRCVIKAEGGPRINFSDACNQCSTLLKEYGYSMDGFLQNL